MLPSICAHLAEFFETKGNYQSKLPSVPALGSPILSELLLPPENRRAREPYTPRPVVFPELFQRGSRMQFHTGYRPSGASTCGDGRLDKGNAAPPPMGRQIGRRVAEGRDNEFAAATRRDDAGEHFVAGIRAPVMRFATPIVPSCSTSESTQVSSESDYSLDDSPEVISAARVLHEMRCGLVKEDNYYNSDADEDEDEDDSPVEEYPRSLKRTRMGGIKTQGTAGVSSTVEETSDAVDTEIDRSFDVVQGREDQTPKLGVWPSPTKRPRLDEPKTFDEIRAAIRGSIRFPPPTSVRVEQVVNDEYAHFGDSKNNGVLEANAKPLVDSAKGNTAANIDEVNYPELV
ncbi:hypothetical protein PLEOSDRAFT_1106006 [Pleurotus ostreatus PC15]|uniref:Uncharacterized protein n=1 Tax=Pleurotus ostreatus (strain PC15) TaxID=1137138 RepID=A0A067NSP0_PLEO1|nr:hypothetical protein PLEOSDRAFT_1106006 [Pleurotus ostreatus PC15]